LEVRKGVLELARAIPTVLAQFPDARFRLIGRSLPHPGTGEDLEVHLRRLLEAHLDKVEFLGPVPYSEITAYLADTDICVFPSIWEASGFVCKEAMAAARGVIGSSGSGMAEIIEDGRTGRLVAPGDVDALAKTMIGMLRDPSGRVAMGRAAREHVLSAFAHDVIGPMQEAAYARAIARAQERPAARPSEASCPSS
jgi:glycosyltransferase involved in cell wall biosynthesis